MPTTEAPATTAPPTTSQTNPVPPNDGDDGVAGDGDEAGSSADVDTVPTLYDDRILGADIWDDELRILSANMGFDGVVGWPDDEFDTIRAGGGSYYLPECADGPIVSGATADRVETLYRGVADDMPSRGRC
jgi:hypothetical protein